MSLAPHLVAASLWAATAGPLEIGTTTVDAGRTEAGLRARTGATLEGFTITVRDADVAGAVDVHLKAADGRTVDRRLVLEGETPEDRSRELASSLALLIEQWDTEVEAPQDPTVPPGPRPEPPPAPRVRGWVGVGPRVGVGEGALAEGGLDVQGGAWLLKEHLQPLGSFGVTGTAQRGISLVHVRVGAGLAVGAALPVDRRFWLGGHVLAHAMFVRASDVRAQTTWVSATELGAVAQYRGRRLFVGLRTGVDLTLPPLTIRGTEGRIRRGPARWFLGLTIGLVFG